MYLCTIYVAPTQGCIYMAPQSGNRKRELRLSMMMEFRGALRTRSQFPLRLAYT